MLSQTPIGIFDIGKTNKKFLIFDPNLNLVHREQVNLPETTDEDGFPTEDLDALTAWVREIWDRHGKGPNAPGQLNVSTYGASLVHLNKYNEPVTPLYNYLKPLPEKTRAEFYGSYGPPEKLALETASPELGMLNSGLQLYWLKHERPAAFKNVTQTLHLPQYLASLFSGKMANDYTSLGCHTALWDMRRSDYHNWVYKERLDKLFPLPGSALTTYDVFFDGKSLRIGTGIHDSSAALIPYLHANHEPFLLLSTGTWSIALNPFSDGALTAEELARDVLYYLDPVGNPVKASRLFLGREHDAQVERLAAHFEVEPNEITNMGFSETAFEALRKENDEFFTWEYLDGPGGKEKMLLVPGEWDVITAYHRLMLDLVRRQVDKIGLIGHPEKAKTLYIDGGFASNQLFVQMLSRSLPGMAVKSVKTSQGTALGAALAIQTGELPEGWVEKHFEFQAIL